MARIKFKQSVLEALGFVRRDLGDGVYDLVRPLRRGWYLQYDGSTMELAHKGEYVQLPCRDADHLETLINIL